jgi:Glycosyl transferase 4-like domain
MRVLIATPAWPPTGFDVERARRAEALGRGALEDGHDVQVLAGGSATSRELVREDSRDEGIELVSLRRGDPWPTHWMRGGDVGVTRELEALLAERRPDVLHVVGWARLTHDLVLTAARAGVPAVLELWGHAASCLLGTRRRPEDGAACDRTFGPYECVSCAAKVPPATPWVPTDQAYLNAGHRAAAIGRELALARARLVPDEDHGEALMRGLGGEFPPLLVPPPEGDPAWLPFHTDLWRRVAGQGPPPAREVGEPEWFESRLRAAAEANWDRAARGGPPPAD